MECTRSSGGEVCRNEGWPRTEQPAGLAGAEVQAVDVLAVCLKRAVADQLLGVDQADLAGLAGHGQHRTGPPPYGQLGPGQAEELLGNNG